MTEDHVPCSEVQQCGSAFSRRKLVFGLKLRRWNVKVLVVTFSGQLRAAEDKVSDESSLVAVMDRKPTGRCI